MAWAEAGLIVAAPVEREEQADGAVAQPALAVVKQHRHRVGRGRGGLVGGGRTGVHAANETRPRARRKPREGSKSDQRLISPG
jgi:hypothetical protein